MSRIRSVRFFETAAESAERLIRQGAERYDRPRHLPALLAGAEPGRAEQNPREERAIRLRLARALRQERTLGRAGHWSYDLNRHIALMQAWRAETQGRSRERDA